MPLIRANGPAALLAGLASLLAAHGCDGGREPDSWPAARVAVVLAEGAPDAVGWAAADLRDLLSAAAGTELELIAEGDEPRARYLLLVGDGPWGCPDLAREPEAFALVLTTYSGRPSLALCGGGLLGRQHAVYAYLHALGFRFVHPEQAIAPELAALPPGLPPGLDEEPQRPGLGLRGFHAHTQHPLELLEALLTDDADEVERAHRFVDWLVRNRQNTLQWILLDSVPEDELLAQAGRVIDYAHARGVRVHAVTSFNEAQQNAHRLLDTANEVDDLDELRAGLDALFAVPWDGVVLNLGSSEFSESDDVATVGWMDETVRHLTGLAPGARAYASNHVPAGTRSETYGVNFYDLPRFADPGLGTYVHTTMCYGLEGPAPVYGNADFSRQRDFLLGQVGVRPIVYYPESAWWLTFDNMIPLFLPVYVRVRTDDIRLVAPVAGVDGHVTFTSGWEWGYWLTDLVIAHHTWSPDRTMGELLAELLGPVHPELGDIVARMAEAQHAALVTDRLMPFLTAEDLPTEIGYRAGIVFHPLAPLPGEVATDYGEAQLVALSRELEALEGFCEELDGFAAELEALAGTDTTPHEVLPPAAQPGRARLPALSGPAPILEELRDGAAVTAARCWNARHGYRALVAARRLALELPTADAPDELVALAAAQTARARALVARREAAYRYEPARTSAHEDRGGAGVDNVTDYPYRVFGRTHVLYFWERRDRLVAEAVAGSGGGLVVAPQQLLAGDELLVDATEAGFDAGTELTVRWGDGDEQTVLAGAGAMLRHAYAAPGQPVLGILARAEGDVVEVTLPVSSATEIFALPSASYRLVEPPDPLTEAALRPFFPSLQLGLNGGGDEALPMSLAFDRDGDGVADHGTVVHLPAGTRSGDVIRVEGFSLTVPVESASGRFGALYLRDALLELELGEASDVVEQGRLRARVEVDELVALLAATGVLERDSLLGILADIFDFDPLDPPETVAVELALSGERVATL